MSVDSSFKQRVSALQAELKAPKARTNKFGGYQYRSCEDILKAVKPLLHKYGLLLTLSDRVLQLGDPDPRYYIQAEAVLEDAQSEERLLCTACAREPEAKKGMDESQITGMASSYARKYALNGLLCIDDVTDPDGARQAAEDALFERIACQDCGYNIRPHNTGKRGYTPGEIAAMTKKGFGKALCWNCAEKRKKENEACTSKA